MRLIDADALIKSTDKESVHMYQIALAPTVEQKHGRWIEADGGDCCYKCSECGFLRDAYILDESNYCPNCGAKMDEVEENG